MSRDEGRLTETGKPERILLAPITITPTKPLTPSHVKGLLWLDVLFRATSLIADVTYVYNHRTYDMTIQTLGFWEFLDRTVGAADYESWTEERIGEHYMLFQAETRPRPYAALRPYLEAVEREGWVHPASLRVLRAWRAQYDLLRLVDPGLLALAPAPRMSVDQLVDSLRERGLCIDLRTLGGGVYLDHTASGLPLRQVITPEGHANYLVCMLRELLPLAGGFDRVLLVHDRELSPDYVLVRRTLAEFGVVAHSLVVERVAIDRRVLSSRRGGWQGYTLSDLVDPLLGEFDLPALRLGMRLYFIAVLDRPSSCSFDAAALRRWVGRAERMLAGQASRVPGPDGEVAALAAYLLGRGHDPWVDPLRLTGDLLSRRRAVPARELIDRVYI